MQESGFVGQPHRLPPKIKGRRSACPAIVLSAVTASILIGSLLISIANDSAGLEQNCNSCHGGPESDKSWPTVLTSFWLS
jgi:hypothetical protein